MKQLTALLAICMLIIASCQKDTELNGPKDISFSKTDFVDNEIVSPGANKNPDRRSNLKVVIRQVNNAENTYRLVLKVDSVAVDLDGDGVEEMQPLGDNAEIEAGLSIADAANPDDALIIFGQNSLKFRRQSENGYYVFVSDPFPSDLGFDYELVNVQYLINPRWTHVAVTHKVAGTGNYFILPNGKTIEQDPKITNFKAKGPGRGGAGASAIFGSMRLTTFDDPIGQVSSVKMKVIVDIQSDAGEKFRFPMEADFVAIGVGNNLGVTIWANEQCMGNYDPTQDPPTWVCEDQLLLNPPPGNKPINDFTLKDMIATFLLMDNKGNTVLTVDGSDRVAGSTDHF